MGATENRSRCQSVLEVILQEQVGQRPFLNSPTISLLPRIRNCDADRIQTASHIFQTFKSINNSASQGNAVGLFEVQGNEDILSCHACDVIVLSLAENSILGRFSRFRGHILNFGLGQINRPTSKVSNVTVNFQLIIVSLLNENTF